MFSYLSGFFREDRPQSMQRVISLILVLVGSALLIYVPPDQRLAAGISAISIGITGKGIGKFGEQKHKQ